MSDSIQAKTKKGLMFRSIESITMQVTSLLLQIILTRILDQKEFGVVAILTTFTNIANTLINNGLGTAIIQQKNVKQVDICTVFYIEFAMGALSYLAIFFAAPSIAASYNSPEMVTYLRVFSLSLFAIPLTSIQNTVGKYRLDFRPSMIANVCAVAAHAGVGIFMAMRGYGVWSLIISQLATHFVRAFMMCALIRWMPSLKFSFKSLKRMFGYSWKLFAGWMIGTLYQDAFVWIIGRYYNTETTGRYDRGHMIPGMVNKVATQVTSAVMFSSMAKYQDDKAMMRKHTRSLISVSCAIILPIMAGLAACSKSLVHVLLTAKWDNAVPVIQIMSIPLALNVISNANMQPINAVGRSDLFLRLEIIKRGITIALVWFFAWQGQFYLMLVSIGAGGILSLMINTYYNNKLFDYRPHEYMLDIVPYALCAGALFVAAFLMNFVPMNMYLRLIIQLGICVGMFLGMIFSGILPGYKALRSTIMGIFKKKNHAPSQDA